MNRSSIILVLLFALFSCTEEENHQLYLNTSKDALVTFGEEGGVKEIKFFSSADWQVYGVNDWCFVSQIRGTAGEVILNITVLPNELPSYGPRSSVSFGEPQGIARSNLIEIKAGGLSIEIEVQQDEAKYCTIDERLYNPSCGAQIVEVVFTTNADDLRVEILDDVDWIRYKTTSSYDKKRVVEFQIDANPIWKERECRFRITIDDRWEYVRSIKQRGNLDFPISFADDIVKLVCVGKYDTDNDGVLTYREVSQVTSLPMGFFSPEYKEIIKTFDEFQYFTSVTKVPIKCFANTSLSSIILPKSVMSLSSACFENCSELENISLSDNLERIDQYAFRGCSKLKSLELPSTITAISNAAFQMMESLESITIPVGVESLTEGLFAGSGIKSLELPSSLQRISDGVFSGCVNLEKLTIPKSVKEIGTGIVAGCSSLSSFDSAYATEDGKFLIKDGILKGVALNDMSSCHLPYGILSIGEKVFSKTENVEHVVIPSSVVSIGDYAFAWAVGLKSIKIEAVEPPIMGVDVFCENNIEKVPLVEISVPYESVDLYKNAEGWRQYQSIIVGY